MRLTRFAPAVILLAWSPFAAAQSSFVNYETPHVHPLPLTPDGATLLAVNTPDNRLEVFDADRQRIGDRVNQGGKGSDETRALTVTANKTYFLLVGGWRKPGGTYTLRVHGPAAPDDHPDAGAWGAATVIDAVSPTA